MTAFFRSEKEKQGASRPVLGQQRYGLVSKAVLPGSEHWGTKPSVLWEVTGRWVGSGTSCRRWVLSRHQPPFSVSSDTEILSVSEQGLCALHLLPLPPFLLGNRELIRPAAHLPFLAPAEEEPAKPKLRMRLCAGAAGGSGVELDGPCLPAEERCPPSSLSHSSGPRERGHEDLMEASSCRQGVSQRGECPCCRS